MACLGTGRSIPKTYDNDIAKNNFLALVGFITDCSKTVISTDDIYQNYFLAMVSLVASRSIPII